MSYSPTTWESGDTITSAKLNKMEQGIANAGTLIVHANNGTLDKTWQEIHDTAPLVWAEDEGAYLPIGAVYEDEGDYLAVFIEPQPSGNAYRNYIASSADGYPALSQ